MTEELLDRGDPVIRRLQQAFAHEELATELAAIMQRAARYQTGESPATDDQPAPGDSLTEADLVAARRRAPFAGFQRKSMARVFLADCQPLFNEALEALITRDGTNEVVGQASAVPQIVASVAQLKPDLFVIDAGLALSSRPTLVEQILAELPDTKVILLAQDTDIDLLLHAIRAGAVGVVGKKSGTQTVLRAVQAVLDGEGVVPRAMLPQLFRRLLDMGDRATDAPLNRLLPREREVLALLGRGWSNAQIGRELYISPHTVRTHVQNILQKLEMHSKLEAVALALERGWAPAADDPEELAIERLEGSRVVAAMRELSPDQREVLLLRMADGLTAPEVAEILGKTTGAVKALQHRGLASLTRVLGLRGPDQLQQRPYPSPDPDHLVRQEEQER